MSINNWIVENLLNIKAIEIKKNENEWFTWSSGIKSPIYCDNRLIISFPEIRKIIVDEFVNIIKKNYPDVQYIAGTATAGIPYASWISDRMNLPMVFVRSEAKKHGKTNKIEGLITKDKKVVIIEDLISTGKSSLNVYQTLKEAGMNVLGVAAIFSYNLKVSQEKFNNLNLGLHTMTNYDTLLDFLIFKQEINEQQKNILFNWKEKLNSTIS